MDIREINRNLVEHFGKDFLDRPVYRVVWSDDLVEKRFGTFRDYVSGTNILLREVTEVREVRKYSYLEPQYVLEKLFINQHNTEILESDTFNPQHCTYEPVWCFGHDSSHKYGKKARQPVWRAIQLLITMLLNPKKLTSSEMNDAEKAQAFKDEQVLMDLLNTHIKSDAMHSAIQDGDAVIVSSNQQNFRENEQLPDKRIVNASR